MIFDLTETLHRIVKFRPCSVTLFSLQPHVLPHDYRSPSLWSSTPWSDHSGSAWLRRERSELSRIKVRGLASHTWGGGQGWSSKPLLHSHVALGDVRGPEWYLMIGGVTSNNFFGCKDIEVYMYHILKIIDDCIQCAGSISGLFSSLLRKTNLHPFW